MKKTALFFTAGLLLILAALTSCSSANLLDEGYSWNFVEIEFKTILPVKPADNEKIFLELIDEVTGIPFNPIRFQMQANTENLYHVKIKVGQNAVVKYRYAKGAGNPIAEYTSQNLPVRYRIIKAYETTSITDSVCAWQDVPFNGDSGKIQGYAIDSKTGAPIANVFIGIAGMQTLTSSDGSFLLESVPVGEQRITALHPNGDYQFFQQGAVIAKDALTPAIFSMQPEKFVNITFRVLTPSTTPENAVVRLIGDTLDTGNTFSDLTGGLSTIASRSPELKDMGSGIFEIKIPLATGSHFRYKYTIGDGFWNAEHKQDGSFSIRELIVPDHDATVNNRIVSWGNDKEIVHFSITTPTTTPRHENISIQLNPFTWMPPLPLNNISENVWEISIFSPIEAIHPSTTFRICRNGLCGIADDAATIGRIEQGQPIINAMRNGEISYSVAAWSDGFIPQFSQNQLNASVNKSDNFIKGYEIYSLSPLSSMDTLNWGIINAAVSGANWIVRSPTWYFDNKNGAAYQIPAKDSFWEDEIALFKSIKESGLNSAVFPRARFSVAQHNWGEAALTYDWWHKWFEGFEKFTIYFADLAAFTESDALIIGGQDFWPVLSGSVSPNASSVYSQDSISKNIVTLLGTLRKHYAGKIWIAIPYSGLETKLPDWISQFDGMYVQVNNSTIDANYLENKLYAYLSRPIIVSLGYVSGAETSECYPALNGAQYAFSPNFQAQYDNYYRALSNLQEKSWLTGVISSGYYSDGVLIDASCSVRGKPAESLISTWFNIK